MTDPLEVLAKLDVFKMLAEGFVISSCEEYLQDPGPYLDGMRNAIAHKRLVHFTDGRESRPGTWMEFAVLVVANFYSDMSFLYGSDSELWPKAVPPS